VSGVELSAAQKKDLGQSLEKKTGKKIEAKYAVDKELWAASLCELETRFTTDRCGID